jgi:6-phosphofructokinase 2
MQGPVRIAFMAHETSTSLEYRFVPEGPVLTETEAAPLLEFAGRFDGDFIVASGSLPRGLASDSYARIAQAAHQKGVKFVLDTSGDALRVTLEQSKVFLVKPSIGELEKLCGHQLDECGAEAAAADLVGRGAADYVEVSMGRHGALLVSGEGVLRAPALHVKTVSAVGAGDSFVGAMTWALSEGKTIQEAFLLGSAAGAAAVMSPGTGLCRREDVFALYDKISKLQFTRPS